MQPRPSSGRNTALRHFVSGSAKLYLFAILLFTAACSGSGPRALPDGAAEQTATEAVRPIPVPPWQLWGSDSMGNPELAIAEEYLEQGRLEHALKAYRDAYHRSPIAQVKDEALLRLSGTLLKLGRSQDALTEISSHLKAKKETAADAGPRLGLVAAYAYIHQKDWDQALAWLGLVQKNTAGQGIYSRRALNEAKRIAEALPPQTFAAYSQRWELDPFVGRIFGAERMRRAQGGAIRGGPSLEWYSASLYHPERQRALEPDMGRASSVIEESDALPTTKLAPPPDAPLVLGILLPLSGQYAQHAGIVKRGIEFAISQMGPEAKVSLAVGDTGGDPNLAAEEYERLVTQEKASLVLGPLLVKTTESVAERAQRLGVPILTFTKREGITGLGQNVFRLGATSSGQVSELVAYATDELGLKTYAVLYPQTEPGREFAVLFQDAVERRGGSVLAHASYYPGDETSIKSAVAQVSARPSDAVFLPDSLDQAFPVLKAIDESALTDSVLLGPATWNDPIAVRGYGQLIDGAVYVAPFFPRSLKPTVAEFVANYMEQFKTEPELLAAQAYDAAWLAVKAFRAPGGQDESLAEKLLDADTLYGVTGKLDVDNDGEVLRRMSVLRLHRGEVVEVMSGGVVSGFLTNEQRIEAQSQSEN